MHESLLSACANIKSVGGKQMASVKQPDGCATYSMQEVISDTCVSTLSQQENDS